MGQEQNKGPVTKDSTISQGLKAAYAEYQANPTHPTRLTELLDALCSFGREFADRNAEGNARDFIVSELQVPVHEILQAGGVTDLRRKELDYALNSVAQRCRSAIADGALDRVMTLVADGAIMIGDLQNVNGVERINRELQPIAPDMEQYVTLAAVRELIYAQAAIANARLASVG